MMPITDVYEANSRTSCSGDFQPRIAFSKRSGVWWMMSAAIKSTCSATVFASSKKRRLPLTPPLRQYLYLRTAHLIMVLTVDGRHAGHTREVAIADTVFEPCCTLHDSFHLVGRSVEIGGVFEQ